MADTNPYSETVVPRAAVAFPLRVPVPEGFVADRPETWPEVTGRLEYFEGELWCLPPCGDDQQDVAADVVSVLGAWRNSHREFVVGTNEAGMKLGGAVRGADAAVWRKADLGSRTGGLRQVPPVLAVEIAGVDDTIAHLDAKAAWYLAHGTQVVWLLVPSERRMVVVTRSGEQLLDVDETVPEHASLPDLSPAVRQLFQQIDEA